MSRRPKVELVGSQREEPTSAGHVNTSRQRRRRETGTQPAGAGDRREDSDRKREQAKQRWSEARTQAVATGRA